MLQYKMLYCNRKQFYLYLISYSHTVSRYNPDSRFSMSALTRLEDTGLQIFTSLNRSRTELKNILGMDTLWCVQNHWNCILGSDVIEEWVSGRLSRHSPTWMTLLNILRKLNLVELSQQIEDYLSGEQVHVYILGNVIGHAINFIL